MFAGKNTLESLLSGDLTVGTFLDTAAATTKEPLFSTPKAKEYLSSFLKASMVSVQCDDVNCRAIYDLERIEWQKDPTCDECGGQLIERNESQFSENEG